MKSPAHNHQSVYALRRKDLIAMVGHNNGQSTKNAVMLCASFEMGAAQFEQESSFYYYTGINEPGAVVILKADGTSTLYLPRYGAQRASWVNVHYKATQEEAKKLGFTTITYLGQEVSGYKFPFFSDKKQYEILCADLEEMAKNGTAIGTTRPDNHDEYYMPRLLVQRLESWIPALKDALYDISSFIATMRRKKDISEIETLYKAVEITILAQGAAAQAVVDGVNECEVQASLEYMFTGSGAKPAFPSIVATGKNATILHYAPAQVPLKNGQLVVVDIGAKFEQYCADLTRTYPVSGSFTKRQKELYSLVLQTQEYIADIAKPGMWLSNKNNPEKSLHHRAKKFLEERGYANHFIHGIGHFIGLDVHDVGDPLVPLAEGDIFTLEPGIYIPEEQIGIRIEDMYWMTKEGVVCLSEALPKRIEDIEQFMQESDDTLEDSSQASEDTWNDESDEEDEFDLAQS